MFSRILPTWPVQYCLCFFVLSLTLYIPKMFLCNIQRCLHNLLVYPSVVFTILIIPYLYTPLLYAQIRVHDIVVAEDTEDFSYMARKLSPYERDATTLAERIVMQQNRNKYLQLLTTRGLDDGQHGFKNVYIQDFYSIKNGRR